MNDEFRRLRELAGIKEMKVGNPLTINVENLKTGDKLLVLKTVFWDREGNKLTLTPTPINQVGDYGAFAKKDDVWEIEKDNVLMAKCIHQ